MIFVKKILFACLFFGILPTAISVAEGGRKTPSLDGMISAGPYYNPASKSYFELFKTKSEIGNHHMWAGARLAAEEKKFKNTRGRLAVIRDLATHQFIINKFSADDIWIGLQYFCETQTLRWVDGTYITESDFTAWAHRWARTSARCAGQGYMPVSYSRSLTTGGVSRWQATGPNKGFAIHLVEYPTGRE